MGFNAAYSAECQPEFLKKRLPSLSGPKPEQNRKRSARYFFRPDFLIGLSFDREGGGHMFLRNVG
jgi:hypothetical protein